MARTLCLAPVCAGWASGQQRHKFGGCIAWRDASGGLEHEYLDCEVGIDVVLTHERKHLAIELSLDDSYEVVTHGGLVVVADLQDAVGVAVLDERALARGERVGEQDGHDVLVDGGLCLRRSATGVLVKYLDC